MTEIDTKTTLSALSDTLEYIQQGLTGVQIRENLQQDYLYLTTADAIMLITYARGLSYRLKES